MEKQNQIRIIEETDTQLSFFQERLWFLAQLEENTGTTYHHSQAYFLKGELDTSILQKGLHELIIRHKILNLGITTRDGQPFCKFIDSDLLKMKIIHLEDTPSEVLDAKLKILLHEEINAPFDLESGPLWRTKLYKISEHKHVLVTTGHHLVCDAWSMQLFWEEFAVLYKAFSTGATTSPLPPLTINYQHYAQWQRKHYENDGEQLDYWKEQLSLPLPKLDLPTDKRRTTTQTFNGGQYSFILPKNITKALNNINTSGNQGLHTTLMAVFMITLYRYTNQTDLVIGTTAVNRSEELEFDKIIGPFANTLALRTKLAKNLTFHEVLERVKQTVSDAYNHASIPFAHLLQGLSIERTLAHEPLFQITFLFQDAAFIAAEWHDLKVRPIVMEQTSTPFDLNLTINATKSELIGELNYKSDIFERDTIRRFASHFTQLIEQFIANPKQSISKASMLTEAERHKLLVEWNKTQKDHSQAMFAHELVARQAQLVPDATAVILDDEKLSYHELNRRANQVAHYLTKQGVGPNVLVGVFMERSIEMMIAILAILKAGSAYVPLDPIYPQKRVEFMVADTAVHIIITQSFLNLKMTSSNNSTSIICIDKEWSKICQQSDRDPKTKTNPNNLAYIIFTSGSTGKPKGITMPHRTLKNLIAWQIQKTVLPKGATTSQFASINFDVSSQEIFLTWATGGTLVLIPEEIRQNPISLLSYLDIHQVQRLFLPFAILQQLAIAAMDKQKTPIYLREIMTAGEQPQLTPELCDFLIKIPDSILHNQYGPSESHIVTQFTVKKAQLENDGRPPMGRPIDNTQMYILDDSLNPLPIGVPGELFIGGDGLSHGYYSRARQTALKYIPNPFGKEQANTRLYKSGDLARYLPDGNIEFLDRLDFQVKIRGFRIELGEIEVTLMQHPHIQETTVVTFTTQDGQKQLIAYFVPSRNKIPKTDDLRRFLQQKLPDYMIPAVFVKMDTLPLTPNGKINRKQLPKVKPVRPDLEIPYEKPSTRIEQTVAQIWTTSLNIDPIGVHDNFFDLGGNSLKLSQIKSRVDRTFQINIPLRILFESSTIAKSSLAIVQYRAKQEDDAILEKLIANLERMSDEETLKLIN